MGTFIPYQPRRQLGNSLVFLSNLLSPLSFCLSWPFSCLHDNQVKEARQMSESLLYPFQIRPSGRCLKLQFLGGEQGALKFEAELISSLAT